MSSILCWFSRDLRLADHPALKYALHSGLPVIPVYLHAPHEEAPWEPGAASRWWLHHSLDALMHALGQRHSRLIIRRGDSLAQLLALIRETGAVQVVWNRCYEPHLQQRDQQIVTILQQHGVQVQQFNAALWFAPGSLCKADGEPYRVFTPFWKRCLQTGLERPCLPSPGHLPAPMHWPASLELAALDLLPRQPWDQGLKASWTPGEAGAWHRLHDFLKEPVKHYAQGRDYPAQPGTARLSAHLHFGEISPAQIYAACQPLLDQGQAHSGIESFIRELGWREFAHHILHHFPHTPQLPLYPKFADFPWADCDASALLRWQQGQTGIPLVDAGMRELWHTGWMHNRVRMICASFLTKNLKIHWRCGARWFWDTLVDADLANNTLGWQWTAGCGADAAPFFRVFNPVTQGERFDPKGDYVTHFVPELRTIPLKYRHQPWQYRVASAPTLLCEAGQVPYPPPMVDLRHSREQVLRDWKTLGGDT